MSDVTITVRANGPYKIVGPVRIVDPAGATSTSRRETRSSSAAAGILGRSRSATRHTGESASRPTTSPHASTPIDRPDRVSPCPRLVSRTAAQASRPVRRLVRRERPGCGVVDVGDVRLRDAGSTREQAFPQVGINISVVEPGESNCLYHSESQQEAFLVLTGECTLLVEGEERPLGPWDFVHCPAGVEHVFVGSGTGPCTILMVGARTKDEQLLYPVSELAARHGASVEEETSDGAQAYAPFERPTRSQQGVLGRAAVEHVRLELQHHLVLADVCGAAQRGERAGGRVAGGQVEHADGVAEAALPSSSCRSGASSPAIWTTETRPPATRTTAAAPATTRPRASVAFASDASSRCHGSRSTRCSRIQACASATPVSFASPPGAPASGTPTSSSRTCAYPELLVQSDRAAVLHDHLEPDPLDAARARVEGPQPAAGSAPPLRGDDADAADPASEPRSPRFARPTRSPPRTAITRRGTVEVARLGEDGTAAASTAERHEIPLVRRGEERRRAPRRRDPRPAAARGPPRSGA